MLSGACESEYFRRRCCTFFRRKLYKKDCIENFINISLWSGYVRVLEWGIYPALTGSKTPTSKFSENKEVRWGSTARKSPIGEG